MRGQSSGLLGVCSSFQVTTMKSSFTLLVSFVAGIAFAATPKALVVMLDGLRADVVENGDMPVVRSLMEGTWQPGYGAAWSLAGSTIRDAITESAPNHVSIATGVSAARHGIGSNADLLHGRNTYGGVAGKPCPSWLSHLVRARPGTKALFVFSWYGDLTLSPDYDVPFLYDRDDANAEHLADLYSRPNAPDAAMWYIDKPDHAGHGHGFYPYSAEYLAAVSEVDRMIGRVLDAVAARPTFAEEDWLVLVVADHGGWRRYHGMMSAQAFTIPFVAASRSTSQPHRILGIPTTCDVAPTALAHFGVDVASMGLDGKPVSEMRPSGQVVAETRLKAASPAAHFPFDGPDPAIELRGSAALVPEGGHEGGFLRVSASTDAPGCALLLGTESLAFENGREFAVALWVRTPGPQTGDPVALSNKDWNHGVNPGLALVAARMVDLSKTGGCTEEERRTGAPGFAVNIGRDNRGRQDVGTYDSPPGEWVFYAATCGADGILRFYQGHPDGHLYCISDNATAALPASGMPFLVGQDGTGRYRYPFVGDIDDLAIWTRGLDHGEIRALFESGCGVPRNASSSKR